MRRELKFDWWLGSYALDEFFGGHLEVRVGWVGPEKLPNLGMFAGGKGGRTNPHLILGQPRAKALVIFRFVEFICG